MRTEGLGRLRTSILLVLFFLSGVAALIYEVLWLKELGLLFGVTAHAAATTLAAFFLGLSVGSLVWGRRSGKLENPLRTYALLELGIALSAVLYFWLLDLYYWIYPWVFENLGSSHWTLLTVKLVLSVGILFLPAFFMGGTLPVMGEFLIRRPRELGTKASALYAINTFGAAVGALAAGFLLPRLLGFRSSFLLAISLNVFVGLISMTWSRLETAPARLARWTEPSVAESRSKEHARLSKRLILVVAICSGFLTLALEVLWTRMFAQVLQNSVYTFATILTVFLVSLALGSVVAHFLCRLESPPVATLFSMLVAAGFAVGFSPLLFYRITSGMEYLGKNLDWGIYSLAVFGGVGAVILIPGLLIGCVLPYLMKHSEYWAKGAGWTIGQLSGVNTVAAIVGSLVAGFLLLDWLGLWAGIRLIAVGYFLLSIAVLSPWKKGRSMALAMVPMLGAVLMAAPLPLLTLPSVRLHESEDLVWIKEGAHGTVAVIQRGHNLRLKVNNHYRLGGAASTLNQRFQAWLPLALHAEPESVFFLGMGTGITAGGALDFPVRRVVVTELNPDVVTAAKVHFRPYLNGLMNDSRVEVIPEDGRNVLAGSSETFDVVVGDVFLTYRAGVGSLYTREHFEIVRDRLEEGGIFAQWIPMLDVSPHEFGIIARTMLEVFPHVSIWRRNMSTDFPIFVMIASQSEQPLNVEGFRSTMTRLARLDHIPDDAWFVNIPLAAFVGHLSLIREEYDSFPISTDDRRPLEYLAPVTERRNKSHQLGSTLQGSLLDEFSTRLFKESVPMHGDPYLSRLRRRDFREIAAGLEIYRYEMFRGRGEIGAAREAWRRYQRLTQPAADAAEGDEGH